MNKKSFVIIAIGTLAIGVIALAIFGVLPGNGKRGNDAGELQSVTLMLDWTPNVNHVGIFVADSEGYFAQQGLDVHIVQPGEVYPAAAVLSGRVQFGIDYQEYLTLLSNEQQGLLSIAAMLQSNTSGFATRAADDIQSVADFAGLTYGTFSAPFEEPTLRALLECSGANSGEIEYVPAGNDLLTMLDRRRADVVWIFYGTQGFQAQQIGTEIDYFPMSDYTDCIPDYYTPIIIALRSMRRRSRRRYGRC